LDRGIEGWKGVVAVVGLGVKTRESDMVLKLRVSSCPIDVLWQFRKS
jgi:hypothetical protein